MNKIKLALRLVLSVGLVVVLLVTADLSELAAILGRGRPLYLLLAFSIGLGDRLLMAVKWNLLLRLKNIRIPHRQVTVTYWISTFFGLFLPATIGGDAVRAYAVSREGHDLKDIVSSIVVERLLGFMALFTFVSVSIILSLAVFGQNFFPGLQRLLWVFGLLLVASAAVLWLSLNERLIDWLTKFVARRLPRLAGHRLAQKIGGLYASYLSYQDDKKGLLAFYLLSLIESLFPLFWTFFLALAFEIDVPLLFFFILIPIVLVLVRLPISIDGFGLQEGAFVYFLGLIGVAAEEALLLGLASHFLALLTVLPGGLFYILGGFGARRGENLKAAGRLWPY